MDRKRARLVPGLLAGLLAAGLLGCAASAPSDDGDAAPAVDGGKTDRGPQRDAPPFIQDTAPLPDGPEGDAASDDAGAADGAAQQDAAGDGGTCTPEADEALGGDTCADAIDKGSLADNTSSHL